MERKTFQKEENTGKDDRIRFQTTHEVREGEGENIFIIHNQVNRKLRKIARRKGQNSKFDRLGNY